jgi:hypothetical protein
MLSYKCEDHYLDFNPRHTSNYVLPPAQGSPMRQILDGTVVLSCKCEDPYPDLNPRHTSNYVLPRVQGLPMEQILDGTVMLCRGSGRIHS